MTINRLRGPSTVVAAPASCVPELGPGIRQVQAEDTLRHAGFEVRAVPAHNTADGRSTRKQHRKGKGVGYLVSTGGSTIYHAGDTDVIPEMGALGQVDCAFLPVGGTFTMDAGEAAEALALVRPAVAVAIHHLHADPGEFVRQAAQAAPGVLALARRIGAGVPLTRPGRQPGGTTQETVSPAHHDVH